MSEIKKILSGILKAMYEDGSESLQIEIETVLRAMPDSDPDYRHREIAMAVFGSRAPMPEPEEPDADA